MTEYTRGRRELARELRRRLEKHLVAFEGHYNIAVADGDSNDMEWASGGRLVAKNAIRDLNRAMRATRGR